MIVDIIKRTTVIDVRIGPRGRAGINGTNGQGVPTGGTTGQVLAKNSNTNYDTGWINLNLTWEGISGKPSTFPPSSHNQAWSTITGTPTTLAGYGIADGITAAAAAAAYAPIDHTQDISTITGLQSALDGKAATVEPSFESAITITDINDPANNGSELNGILIESNRDSLAQYQQQIVFGNGDKMGRIVAPALVSDYEWYLPQSTGSIMLDSDNTGGIDATRLTSGTINTARLPGTVLLAGGALGTPSSGVLTNCTNIPAANLTGTINTARLPATITGLTSVTSTTFVGALTGTASNNLALTGGTIIGALTGNINALATTTLPAVNLINSTAALVGAQVQVSPALIFEGQAWKTNTTAGSQSVRFRQSVLPIAGAAAPSGIMLFQSDINGANTWTNRLGIGFGSTVNGLYTEPGGGIFFAGISAGNQNNVGISGSGLAQLNLHANGGITHSIVNNASQGLMQAFNAGGFAWSSTGTAGFTADLILLRAAAASLQLGVNHATTATNQTIKAHNVTTGTGPNLILSGGTGSVANGVVIISRLPTSNPGPGILWNNAGTPAIGT